MSKYLKLFETHSDYTAFTATTEFILPNVSHCINENDVHYNPLPCEETSVYEVIDAPTYPSTVDGDLTSFEMTIDYRRTDTDTACIQTVTEGTDIVTVEIGANPSTTSVRTVSGTVDYHGNEIEYSITQTQSVAKVTAKFNITSTSSPTRIASGTTSFTKIEIDGVEQPSITTGYTFSTSGEHEIIYYLTGTEIGDWAFEGCGNIKSLILSDNITKIGSYCFYGCGSLTTINIPKSLSRIMQQAFKYCASLNVITSSAITAPIINSNTFQNVKSNGTLYVPQESTGYNVWMNTSNYYLGLYNWTKVEQ